MNIIQSLLNRFGEWLSFAIIAGVIAASIALFTKKYFKFLIGLIVVTLIGLYFYAAYRYDPRSFLDPGLPRGVVDHFWKIVLGLLLLIVAGVTVLIRLSWASRPAVSEEEAADGEARLDRFPDLEAAWRQVQIRLSQAQVDLGEQHVVLVLSPDEATTASLVRSAGLPVLVEAPETDAPIHAYATRDAVLLSVSGASAFGAHGAVEGQARFEALCRLLRAEDPDRSVVRGVAALLPVSWSGQPEAVKWSAALREDLTMIERVLRVRCPVFLLVPEMETVSGFAEFIDRMPREARQQRIGFAVPASQPAGDDLLHRGFLWVAGWFHSWVLNLTAGDPFNHAGNNRLFLLDDEVRRLRHRWRKLADSALATHRDREPALLRGCYLMATGPTAEDQAFSAGLLRGPRARIVADHVSTAWTRDAIEDDRRYRRLALILASLGGLLCALVWAYAVWITRSPLWLIPPLLLAGLWIWAWRRIARGG